MRIALAAAFVALLAACSPLTAEAPLFTPADQDEALTFAQGLWVAANPDCKVNPTRSRPERKTCLEWARLTREADGRWMLAFFDDDDDDGPLRVVLAPAVETRRGGVAPLYAAEALNAATGAIAYGGVVVRGPRGEDDMVRRFSVVTVTCDVAAGLGDIDVVRSEDGRITGCFARTKEAVKEATRRAALDALRDIGENDLVFVRP